MQTEPDCQSALQKAGIIGALLESGLGLPPRMDDSGRQLSKTREHATKHEVGEKRWNRRDTLLSRGVVLQSRGEGLRESCCPDHSFHR